MNCVHLRTSIDWLLRALVITIECLRYGLGRSWFELDCQPVIFGRQYERGRRFSAYGRSSERREKKLAIVWVAFGGSSRLDRYLERVKRKQKAK